MSRAEIERRLEVARKSIEVGNQMLADAQQSGNRKREQRLRYSLSYTRREMKQLAGKLEFAT